LGLWVVFLWLLDALVILLPHVRPSVVRPAMPSPFLTSETQDGDIIPRAGRKRECLSYMSALDSIDTLGTFEGRYKAEMIGAWMVLNVDR
jgi:hypothetical protein